MLRGIIKSSHKHPWSKLKKALQSIIAPTTGFQIYCCAYDIGQCVPLPRYWIMIGKTIVWDFPKDFMDKPDWYFWTEAKKLSCLIREYVDCPKEDLLSHKFDDRWGLIPYLNACDRRIGKRRLKSIFQKTENSAIKEIILKRLS